MLPPQKKRRMPSAKKLKFVHITKTAGTSIEEASNMSWGRYDTSIRDATCSVPYVYDGSFWHIPPKYYEKSDLKTMLKSFDLFIVVRNPFDRVISEYHCKWGGPKTKHDTVDGFNAWVCQKIRTLQSSLERECKNQPVHGHWTPQYLYLFDSTGNRIICDDNVLKFENLGADFSKLISRYPEFSSVDLSNTDRMLENNKKRFAVSDLSQEALHLIETVYAKDFEIFGYPLLVSHSHLHGIKTGTSILSAAPSSISGLEADKKMNILHAQQSSVHLPLANDTEYYSSFDSKQHEGRKSESNSKSIDNSEGEEKKPNVDES